jgi:hypothetical protein
MCPGWAEPVEGLVGMLPPVDIKAVDGKKAGWLKDTAPLLFIIA